MEKKYVVRGGKKRTEKEKEENIWEKNIWPVEEKMSREGKGRKYGEGKLMLTPTTKTNNRQTG